MLGYSNSSSDDVHCDKVLHLVLPRELKYECVLQSHLMPWHTQTSLYQLILFENLEAHSWIFVDSLSVPIHSSILN